MDFEKALEEVGSFGKFQKLIAFAHFMLVITYGFQLTFLVIAAATPDPNIPSEQNMTTIVTEWHLENERWIIDLSASLLMVGYGIGCIVMGQISDLYGRKNIMLLNYVLLHVSSFCCYFTNGWKTFTFLRTICGFGIGGSGHIVFTLMLENMGKEYWGTIGLNRIVYTPFFSVGVMLLSLLGYWLQNWRTLCLVGSLFPLLGVPIYAFVFPESSRWLYNVGRVKEAEKVLKYIAKRNGRPAQEITLCSPNECNVIESADLKKYSIIDMFRSKKLAIYAGASFYVWFASSFVYFGLTLDPAVLSPNIFIANTLSGAIECPAYLIIAFTINRKSIGRKGTLVGSFVLSSVASIGMLFASGLMSDHLSTIQTVLGLINKLAVSAAFTLLYIYTAEIFPTQLRLVAIGGSSFFARVGAVLSPFVPLLAQIHAYLPFVVYGIASVFGAMLNLIFPETLNKPSAEMSDFIPDNVENKETRVAGDSQPASYSDEEPLLKV